MQEKVKKKRNGLTAKLEKRNARVHFAWIGRLLWETLYASVAYVIGFGQMLFDTSPLGLALLCGGRGHVVSILIGLILSAIVRGEMTAVYVVMYVAAAIVRLISRMLLDAPDERERIGGAMREKLREAEKNGQAVGGLNEAEDSRWGRFWATARAELATLFDERIRLRMATAAICSSSSSATNRT